MPCSDQSLDRSRGDRHDLYLTPASAPIAKITAAVEEGNVEA